MNGKLIEIGDLECLEGQPDNERSGVVILIDRAQLKASRNLFGEVVEVVPASLIASLRRDLLDPPADVQELVIKKLNLVSADALEPLKDTLRRVLQYLRQPDDCEAEWIERLIEQTLSIEGVKSETIAKLEAEVEKRNGIIARNAATRLSCNEDGEILKLYVTANDIKQSLDILYAEIEAGREPQPFTKK